MQARQEETHSPEPAVRCLGGGGNSGAATSGSAFEQHQTGSPPGGGWTASLRGDGKIVVDTARAFSGKQSLHVSGEPIRSESPTAYVRFMMYATSYPASSGVHTRLMRMALHKQPAAIQIRLTRLRPTTAWPSRRSTGSTCVTPVRNSTIRVC